MKSTALIPILVCVASLAGCSGGGRGTVEVVDADSVVAPPKVMPDTFVEEVVVAEPETIPEPEPVREVLLPDTSDESAMLRARMDASPDSAKYAEGVMPLIAAELPEYAERLLDSTYDGFVVADKGTLYVYLYDRWGRERRRYHMCAGKNRGNKVEKGDSRTPEGFFSVEGIYDSTDWLFTDDDGHTSKVKGQFGPRFIRLRTPISTQIGIHGTNAPGSLGSRSSHGCMRISNEGILELVTMVEPGMPVIVNPGKKDSQINTDEENPTPFLRFYTAPAPLPPPLPD